MQNGLTGNGILLDKIITSIFAFYKSNHKKKKKKKHKSKQQNNIEFLLFTKNL